jgi:phosphoenolpyruvate carboxykinase (ATP)
LNELGSRQSRVGLDAHGIRNVREAHWNLTAPDLCEAALARGEGKLAQGGAFVALTGRHTGRSPNDRFIVEEPTSRDHIWWGRINRPIAEANFERVREKMLAHLQGRDLFVQDLFVGAHPDHRLSVRVVTEQAWHSLFARNMFIRPRREELAGFRPEYTVIQAPSLEADPKTDGTSSGAFILVHYAKGLVLIGGTGYAGEIKKSVFSIMNYLMPARAVLPMHCSANIGAKDDTAIFFGLSGTGKTTLSADSRRTLIGDDEHGWSRDGIFNFEGGCYAKVINLSPEAEPEIYATTRMFGTVLENVVMDEETRELDLDDASLTENTRASYTLDRIPNASATGIGGHPRNIVMLTCDAFGVLPPVGLLSPAQAMYHFLSGYTAKVAGTEKGVREPQVTFSTCFGAPFMPRHPTVYARLLGEKMAAAEARCWLLNTGWSGGGFGVGRRMEIRHTRALLNAALDGRLARQPMAPDPVFGVMVPERCPGVPREVLKPRDAWRDAQAYDARARELTRRFADNFRQFETEVDDKVKAAAIRAAA